MIFKELPDIPTCRSIINFYELSIRKAAIGIKIPYHSQKDITIRVMPFG